MGIFSKFLGITTKSTVRTDNGFAGLMFGNQGTIQVTQPYANVPAVYKAIKAIIDNASNIGFKLQNDKGEDIQQFPEILELFSNVIDQAGRGLTLSELIQAMAGYYAMYGEIFFIKLAETQGQLMGTQLVKLMIVNPKDVQEQVVDKMFIGWTICTKQYTFEQVLQIKDFNPYSLFRGISPIKVIMDELRIETGASEHLWSLFINGATPGMIIETENQMSTEQQMAVKRNWEARHQGSKNAGKIAVLAGGAKAKQFGMSNVDMQLSEIIAKAEEKIIGMWRVPKAMFGYTDNLNRATFLGQLNVFYTMTIIPMLNKFEDTFNKELVWKYKGKKVNLRFDYSNVEALQGQINEMMDTAIKLNQIGFTRNEINTRLNLGFEDNKDWGNDWWIPFSQQPAGMTYSTPDVEPKSVKKKSVELIEVNGLKYTKASLEHIKNFNKIHDSLHKDFTKAVKGYFDGLRKRTLDILDDSFKGFADVVNKQYEVNISWTDEERYLIEAIEDYERRAINQGVEQGTRVTGLTPSDRLKYNLNSATKQRMDLVKDSVIHTTQEQINRAINEAINAGGGVEEVKQAVKQYYNKTNNRAEVIARTEITAQLNSGLLLQYDDVGVEQKQWVTNIDEFTRESHLQLNGEVRRMNESFSNGLMMPGDMGDPAETISCRCSVFPVIEERE